MGVEGGEERGEQWRWSSAAVAAAFAVHAQLTATADTTATSCCQGNIFI